MTTNRSIPFSNVMCFEFSCIKSQGSPGPEQWQERADVRLSEYNNNGPRFTPCPEKVRECETTEALSQTWMHACHLRGGAASGGPWNLQRKRNSTAITRRSKPSNGQTLADRLEDSSIQVHTGRLNETKLVNPAFMAIFGSTLTPIGAAPDSTA
jgi:hypothetical protein